MKKTYQFTEEELKLIALSLVKVTKLEIMYVLGMSLEDMKKHTRSILIKIEADVIAADIVHAAHMEFLAGIKQNRHDT